MPPRGIDFARSGGVITKNLAPAVMVGVVAVVCAGCAEGGSPTAASTSNGVTAAADVAGQYIGSYRITNCVADGAWVGSCEESGLTGEGVTLPIALALTQTQSTVGGNLELGALTGAFQGTVSGAAITGTATLPDSTDQGVVIKTSVVDWTTTLSGSALSGGFKLFFQVPGSPGSATLTAAIIQLTR